MSLEIRNGEYYSLYRKAFTNNYEDKDGDNPCSIVIFELPDPSMIVLFFEEKTVKQYDCIPIGLAEKLRIKRVTSSSVNTGIKFKISDDNQNKLLSNMATVNISIAAYVNQKPSAVGDLSISINSKATKVFTSADFTDNTIPKYSDPEGDAPSMVKVLTLPQSGTLRLGAQVVTVNQEIPFASIIAGSFTYTANQSTITAHNSSFDFEMSDTGSGQYTA